jgi:1-deoxy-D-xylulose-5-phosphate synthase
MIMNLGGLLPEAVKAHNILKKRDLISDVYNLRFAAPLDIPFLTEIINSYQFVFFIEEGVKNGGSGEYLKTVFSEPEGSVHFYNYGVPNQFLPHATRKELIQQCRLDGLSLAASFSEIMDSARFMKVVEQVKNDKWKSHAL